MKFNTIIKTILNEERFISRQDRINALKTLNSSLKKISIWYDDENGRAYQYVDDMGVQDSLGHYIQDYPSHPGVPWNENTFNQIKEYFSDGSIDHIDFQDLKVTEEGKGWKMYKPDSNLLGLYGKAEVSFFVVDSGLDVRKCKDEYNKMVGLEEDIYDYLKEESISKEDRVKALKDIGSNKPKEYILYIGFSDRGEEYGNIKRIFTSNPKHDLVQFALELQGEEEGGINIHSIEGTPGNYFCVNEGDDNVYLAQWRSVFQDELSSAFGWEPDNIQELMNAVDRSQSGRLSYEYYQEEGYLTINNEV